MSSLLSSPDHAPLADYDLASPVEIVPPDHQGVNNKIFGVRTGAGDFVGKIYSSYDGLDSIHYEHRLLAWLVGRGLSFSVPVPYPTRNRRLLARIGDGWMSLTPRLPGVSPEFRLINGRRDPHVLEHAELLGSAIGELQVALLDYPSVPRPGRSLFGGLFDFPPSYLDPFALEPAHLGLPNTSPYADQLRWWCQEAARLREFVDGDYRALPYQICHNDVSPANILVEGGRVSAVLDFEFATYAPRALDVAMGLRMTMQAWDNPEPWAVACRFCQGYKRWMWLSEAEVLALPKLLRLRTAIPFLWWLGRPGARGDAERIGLHVEKLQNLHRWLARYQQRFIELVIREAT